MKLYDTRFKEGLPSLNLKEEIESRVSEVTCPEDIYDLCRELEIHLYTEEYLYVFVLNKKCHLLGGFEVGHGTVDSCVVSPREILIRLLLLGAVHCILVHNHTSGICEPSIDDLKTTKRIFQASKIVGVEMLDHVIIAADSFLSLHDEKMLDVS